MILISIVDQEKDVSADNVFRVDNIKRMGKFTRTLGAYSTSKHDIGEDLALILLESVEESPCELTTSSAMQARREELCSLLDKHFKVGQVAMRGTEFCQSRGILMARILSTGMIHKKSLLTIAP